MHRGNTVLLAAFDGVPEFIDLICQGKIVASGTQQPYLMGVRSAQAMFDHLDGKRPPKEILVPIIVVSQKNLDEELPTITQTAFANDLKKQDGSRGSGALPEPPQRDGLVERTFASLGIGRA